MPWTGVTDKDLEQLKQFFYGRAFAIFMEVYRGDGSETALYPAVDAARGSDAVINKIIEMRAEESGQSSGSRQIRRGISE